MIAPMSMAGAAAAGSPPSRLGRERSTASSQLPHQLGVELVARAVGDDVAA